MSARSVRTPAFAHQLWLSFGLALAACGAPTAEAPPPSTPAVASTPAAAPAKTEAPARETAPAAAPAATGAEASSEPPASAATTDSAPPAEEQRVVKYIVTPEGPRVEVGGVKFVPKVEAVRTQLGFIVKVTVSATASEERHLLAPKSGPLAFAGSVKRTGQSEPERFGDEREGDADEPLGAGTTVKLSREWPGKSKVRPLGNGDVLELDVALWGLGSSAGDRRAVKQFLRVKAKVEKWKGRASVEPPPSMKGK